MLRKAFVSLRIRECVILLSVLGHLTAHTRKYGYEYIPNVGGWLRLHMVPATWADAQLRCQVEGGTLASPTSSALASGMMAIMAEQDQNSDMVYTGINAIIAKGDYMTVEGVPLSNISLSWADGEPDNYENSEDCLVMNENGELADVNCSRVFRFFCFKSSAKMTTTNCGTWDSEYQLDPRTGICYKFHTGARIWNRAALTCRAEQAHLAVINNDTEAQVLKELFDKHPRDKTVQDNRDVAFVGFWDWQKQGEWRTIFDQTLAEAGFGRWNDNEPNNHMGKEYCGTLHRNGRLNDFNCDSKSVFICEILP